VLDNIVSFTGLEEGFYRISGPGLDNVFTIYDNSAC
jgi:hypothetical protein